MHTQINSKHPKRKCKKKKSNIGYNKSLIPHTSIAGQSPSVSQRHPFHLVSQRPPIVSLQLGILDPLLTPVLMQPADVILGLLEIDQLVADALFDEYPARMLLHNRLFVLPNLSV